MTEDHLQFIDLLSRRVPRIPVTYALIVANVLVFSAMLLFGAGLWHSSNGVQLEWGANFGPATKDGQWWRLGSAMFLHFGLLHLAMNMLALWDGGRLVERIYGHGRFTLIYLASGLSGNLLSLIVQGDHAVSGGASGAIFGVYGAYLWFLWHERSALKPFGFKWLFWGAAGFSVIAISFGFLIPGIDNAAHLGGLAAGILAGAALARPLDPGQAPDRRVQRLAAGTLALISLALAAGIPAPSYRWSEEKRAQGEIKAFLGEDVRIVGQWNMILGNAQREGVTFDQLAGRIEAEVASPYAESFDQLSKLRISSATPSSLTLETLRQYAEMRRDASRALVEGLRANDPERIHEALEMASQATEMVEGQVALSAPKSP